MPAKGTTSHEPREEIIEAAVPFLQLAGGFLLDVSREAVIASFDSFWLAANG